MKKCRKIKRSLGVDNKKLSAYTILLVTEQIKIKESGRGMQEREKTGADSGAQDVGRLVNTVSHQLKRQMCAHESEDSLTNMQRHVLHYILFESLQRDIYQKDIEKEFQIRRSTATGTLQLLEKNGFIRREPVERDARLKRVIPTDKAEGIREHIFGNIRYVEALLKKGIPEEKLDVCMEVLWKMSENLEAGEKASGPEKTGSNKKY